MLLYIFLFFQVEIVLEFEAGELILVGFVIEAVFVSQKLLVVVQGAVEACGFLKVLAEVLRDVAL